MSLIDSVAVERTKERRGKSHILPRQHMSIMVCLLNYIYKLCGVCKRLNLYTYLTPLHADICALSYWKYPHQQPEEHHAALMKRRWNYRETVAGYVDVARLAIAHHRQDLPLFVAQVVSWLQAESPIRVDTDGSNKMQSNGTTPQALLQAM